jgi:hypothetical protein
MGKISILNRRFKNLELAAEHVGNVYLDVLTSDNGLAQKRELVNFAGKNLSRASSPKSAKVMHNVLFEASRNRILSNQALKHAERHFEIADEKTQPRLADIFNNAAQYPDNSKRLLKIIKTHYDGSQARVKEKLIQTLYRLITIPESSGSALKMVTNGFFKMLENEHQVHILGGMGFSPISENGPRILGMIARWYPISSLPVRDEMEYLVQVIRTSKMHKVVADQVAQDLRFHLPASQVKRRRSMRTIIKSFKELK